MGDYFFEQYNVIKSVGDKADLDVYESGSIEELAEKLKTDTGLLTLKFATALSQDIALKLSDVESF